MKWADKALAHALRGFGVALWVFVLWLLSLRIVMDPHGVAEWALTIVGGLLLAAWLAALIIGKCWEWADSYESLRSHHLPNAGRDGVELGRDGL